MVQDINSVKTRGSLKAPAGSVSMQNTAEGRIQNKHIQRLLAWNKHLAKGVMDVTILVNPIGEHFDRVIQAMEIVNAAQTYYRLRYELDENGTSLAIDNKTRSAESLRNKIIRRFPNRLIVAMTEHGLTEEGDDVTMSEAPGCTIISCEDWIEFDDAPPTRVYLVYQLVSALTTFSACLTETENGMMMHKENEGDYADEEKADVDDDEDFLRGCLFDYWVGAKLLYRSMVSARLCPQCRSTLLAHGAPLEAVSATEKLLDWVRSVILEREGKLPRKVFIGHGGQSRAWQELRDMLISWGLETEEFNEEPAAGISVSQRLKSMLEDSRFAFLVMTAENIDDKGRLHARMNVIHEIGLFQGRLGTECAIVLRDRTASTFSNLDGITRMDFDKDHIAALREEIHRLLISRGVISADVPKEGFSKET